MKTYDPRGISVVVRSCGKTYKHAIDRAMRVLNLWYGREADVKLYAINVVQPGSMNPEDENTERGQYIIHALGLHKDGELVECDPNASGRVHLPHDTPCVHGSHASELPMGAANTSTIGQNRGGYVAVEYGTGWRGMPVQAVTQFQINKDGEVWPSYKLPGYTSGDDKLVLE
jgi:hypothetical protein